MLTSAKALALLGAAGVAHAIGLDACVSFTSSFSAFPVFASGKAAPILLDAGDWPGVQRAAADFATDVHRVSGHTPAMKNATTASAAGVAGKAAPIIIGTLGKSALLDAVVKNAKIDTSKVSGQWEAYHSVMVKNPLPGIDEAYVIMGADKRGTIFALYDHSEQMGVSPWWWWADVPTQTQKAIYASGCSHGAPSVKYRGIFLNDEQPALQNWAQEKFTNSSTAAPFNRYFYSNLFELILRMRGNTLWPAMWAGMFAVDDPMNQWLADMFGVVMGTSHQEPMARSTPNEWNIDGNGGPWSYTTNAPAIRDFWTEGVKRAEPYETLYTLGMRGAGDIALGPSLDLPLLEGIVKDQRTILTDVLGTANGSVVPQVWCLYSEVQGYYEEGMSVPDDVTLLWTDDNWGNIRRVPITSERNRTGGAGVYYHIDYVGNPRDYKWIQSTPIEKTYEQMSYALEASADRLWILNVGDMKPYEMHTEFFLTLGYDAANWNPDNLSAFRTQWAVREFNLPVAKAQAVADVLGALDAMNMNRKPELLNSTTYSLTNYREADRILGALQNMSAVATPIYNSLSSAMKPAFFQLVQHPIQATSTLVNMWVAAGMNNLRASQARVSANGYAATVESLFETDYDLEHEYHTLLDGKWDHMMDQTHVMYYYWQQPMTNTMPMVTKVQSRKQALAGPMRFAIEGLSGAWPGDNPNQCAQGYNCPAPTLMFDPYLPTGNRYFDIGSGGPASFKFVAAANVTWLEMSATTGSISPAKPEQRIYASVDWSKVSGAQTAAIMVNATVPGQPMQQFEFFAVANKTAVPAGYHGFVEGDGGVSMQAAHATRNTSVGEVAWRVLPNLGRDGDAVTPWPRLGNGGTNYTAGEGPHLEYDFYTFHTVDGQNVTVTAYVSPTLNNNAPDRPIALALQMDALPPFVSHFIPAAAAGALPAAWGGNDGFVANNVVAVTTNMPAAPGAHTLKVWMVEPAVVVQKLVVNTGGVLPSYLGPPESVRV